MGSNKYLYNYKNKVLACFQTRPVILFINECMKIHGCMSRDKLTHPLNMMTQNNSHPIAIVNMCYGCLRLGWYKEPASHIVTVVLHLCNGGSHCNNSTSTVLIVASCRLFKATWLAVALAMVLMDDVRQLQRNSIVIRIFIDNYNFEVKHSVAVIWIAIFRKIRVVK